MTPAVIGLIGVLVGGLMTSFLGRQLERVKIETTAANSGFILSRQLLSAASRLKTAAKQKEWWETELSVDPVEPLKSLMSGLRSHLADVSNAFVLIQTWSAEWNKVGADKAVGRKISNEEQVAEMLQSASAIEATGNALFEAAERLRLRQLVLRRFGQVALLSSLVLVISLMALPREHNTAKSVARELVGQLGSDYSVDCDPDGEDWVCQAIHLVGGPQVCPGVTSMRQAPAGVVSRPVSYRSVNSEISCNVQARTTIDVYAADADRLVVVPRAPPVSSSQASVERSEVLATMTLPVSRDSLFARIWKGFIGSDY